MNKKILLIALAALSIPLSNAAMASQLRYYQNLSFDSKVVSGGATDDEATKPDEPVEPAPDADPETTTCDFVAGSTVWQTNKTTGGSTVTWSGHYVGMADSGATSLVSGGMTYYRNGEAKNNLPRFQGFEVCRITKASMGQGTWEPIAAQVSAWNFVSENPADYYDCTYNPDPSLMPAGKNFKSLATNCKMATTRTVQNMEMNTMTFETRNAGLPYTESSYEVTTGTVIMTITGTRLIGQ